MGCCAPCRPDFGHFEGFRPLIRWAWRVGGLLQQAPSQGDPSGGFDRHGTAAPQATTRAFSLALIAICVPNGREYLRCHSQGPGSPPDCPDPRSKDGSNPGARPFARLGRFRSGLRWPTHTLLALRAPECERVMAQSITLSRLSGRRYCRGSGRANSRRDSQIERTTRRCPSRSPEPPVTSLIGDPGGPSPD